MLLRDEVSASLPLEGGGAALGHAHGQERTRKVLLMGLPHALDVTLSDHLSAHGWEVHRAADGRDALRRWEEIAAPVVLTDLEGGGGDAFDAFELSALRSPPQVVLCTPHALAERFDAETLSLLGIAAVLRMPCAPSAIARALDAMPVPTDESSVLRVG